MGIFSNATPFDEPLDKATNEMNTETDWGLIMTICDKVKTVPKGPHEFVGLVLQKINHRVPHVSMQALTVLDACVNNCGKDLKKELASQGFTDSVRDILYRYKNKTVLKRLKFLIRKWAEEFKDDSELSHFVSFYYAMRGDGMEFPEEDEDDPSKVKKTEPLSTDPNSVSSQQEADDIAKAIEASLKEEQQRKGYISSQPPAATSLYPSVLGNASSTSYSGTASYTSSTMNTPKKRVKALYDFEAAEDNELTFKAGDMLSILDDSDPNWWRGEGANGSGLFPSNFVTTDLSAAVEPEVVTSNGVTDESEDENEKESVVKFSDELETKEFDKNQPVLEVNEDLIDETLAVLQSTDPETTTTDSPQLLHNEDSCNQMGKLIDNKLEAIDRKHLELTLLNEKILESLKLYDTLMKQMPVYPNTQPYMPGQMLPPVAGMPGQPGPAMMAGYQHGSYPAAAGQYMPQGSMQGVPPSTAPGPSGAPPTMAPGPIPSQIPPTQTGYNPMYQQQSAYPVTNGNVTTIDQQQAMMQQQGPHTAYGSQNYSTSSGNVSHATAYGTPMMSQYGEPMHHAHGSFPSGGSPNHFPANQASSQPLM